jgi:hypothetical protein
MGGKEIPPRRVLNKIQKTKVKDKNKEFCWLLVYWF